MPQGGKSSSISSRGRFARIYLAAALVLVAVFVQATILARVHLFSVSPNLVLVLAVIWSLLRGTGEGLVWAFLGGLAVDLIAGLPLGGSSLALMAVCYLTVLGEGRLFQGHVVLAMLAVAAATPIYGWLVLLIQQICGMQIDWAGSTLRVILPELMLNAVLASLVYPGLRRLLQQMGGDRLEW